MKEASEMIKTYKIIITTGTTRDPENHIYLIDAECLDDAIAEARSDLGQRGIWVSGQVVSKS